MIPRILVPRDATLVETNGSASPQRISSELDARTVVPAGLPARPLDGRTAIPSHVPLDVLVTPVLVPRDLPVQPFQDLQAIPAHVPLSVLDSRTVVPAGVVPPTGKALQRIQGPPVISRELVEVIEPDIITTGEVNFLAEEEKRRDALLQNISRTASIAAHAAVVLLIVFWSAIFPERQPSGETEIARNQITSVYLPPNTTPAPKATPAVPPTPKIRVDPRVLRQLEAPVSQPAPSLEPPAPTSNPAQPASPADLPPSRLESAKPPQPVKKLNLTLPNLSPAKSLQQTVQDTLRHPGGGGVNSQGMIPIGRGERGGGEQSFGGEAFQILTPTEGVDFTSYLERLRAIVQRNWDAIIPESARLGDKGVVIIQFHIERSGDVPAEEPYLTRTSGKEPLDRAAMAAIRASSPFEPLPSAFGGPNIELRCIFLYNLPLDYFK